MLGLFQTLSKQVKGAVLPGGLVTDGDWLAMTSVDWADQDVEDWPSWENTSDGE
tara:strand:+ start:362 stop:523 length:162 start_codon:yes stop_codon:yes gene_type:complete